MIGDNFPVSYLKIGSFNSPFGVDRNQNGVGMLYIMLFTTKASLN